MDAPDGYVAVRGRAGVVRFVPDPSARSASPPAPSRVPRRRAYPERMLVCACGGPRWRKSKVCRQCYLAALPPSTRPVGHQHDDALERLMAVLERTLSRTRTPWDVCDCGCLIRPNELCPACVVPWIRANDMTPDPVVYYQPRNNVERRQAA